MVRCRFWCDRAAERKFRFGFGYGEDIHLVGLGRGFELVRLGFSNRTDLVVMLLLAGTEAGRPLKPAPMTGQHSLLYHGKLVRLYRLRQVHVLCSYSSKHCESTISTCSALFSTDRRSCAIPWHRALQKEAGS